MSQLPTPEDMALLGARFLKLPPDPDRQLPQIENYTSPWGIWTVVMREPRPFRPLILAGLRPAASSPPSGKHWTITGPHAWVMDTLRCLEAARLPAYWKD